MLRIYPEVTVSVQLLGKATEVGPCSSPRSFAALVAITRTHVAVALRELGQLVSGERQLPDPVDLLARIQDLSARRPT